MVSAAKIAVAATVTAVVAGLGYVFYFDYQRRNNRQFRRKLRRERKRATKAAAAAAAGPAAAGGDMSLDEINRQARELLDVVSAVKIPETPAEKEGFFMEQVSKGEELSRAGPAALGAAACCFFLALRVYPNPVELVMIYQKTTPELVFKLVMAMMAQEVAKKHARYFDVFPPKGTGVQIKDKNKTKAADGAKTPQGSGGDVVVSNRALFATKDVGAGEVVFEEESVVSTLLPRAQNGRFCDHCLKAIAAVSGAKEGTKEDAADVAKEDADEDAQSKEAQAPEPTAGLKCDKCDAAVYCSEKCRQDALDAYHQFLCTGASGATAREFAALTRESHELAPVLIAKFFGVLVDREKKKELERMLGAGGGGGAGAGPSEADEYTTWEHLEWMRYLELVPTPADAKTLAKLNSLVGGSVPGMAEFVNGDRYTMLKGKLDFNAYAVHASGAAPAPVPPETEDTHVSDTMRSDGRADPVGIALYLIASHIAHDCDPNVQIVFPDGTDRAAVKALRPIAAGDELRVAYVSPALDVETRRTQLRESYRISCTCAKCTADLEAKSEEDTAGAKAEATAEADAEVKAAAEAKTEDAGAEVEATAEAMAEDAAEIHDAVGSEPELVTPASAD